MSSPHTSAATAMPARKKPCHSEWIESPCLDAGSGAPNPGSSQPPARTVAAIVAAAALRHAPGGRRTQRP
jgi:hypothetical protein